MWNVPGWRSRASKEVADVRILTFLSRFLMFFWYHKLSSSQGCPQSRGQKWMLGSTWLWIVEPEAVGSPNSTPKRADFDMEMPPTRWTTFGVPPHAPFWIHSGRRCPSRDFALRDYFVLFYTCRVKSVETTTHEFSQKRALERRQLCDLKNTTRVPHP